MRFSLITKDLIVAKLLTVLTTEGMEFYQKSMVEGNLIILYRVFLRKTISLRLSLYSGTEMGTNNFTA